MQIEWTSFLVGMIALVGLEFIAIAVVLVVSILRFPRNQWNHEQRTQRFDAAGVRGDDCSDGGWR